MTTTQLEREKLEATVYNPGPKTYEARLVPSLFKPWARRLLNIAAPSTGERVLDLACGTGIVARLAAARVGPGGTVVGLDVNPAMLDVAKEASAGISPMIDWYEGNAVELPFADASFDLVLCQQGLQFFSDRQSAISEVERVTTPRGRAAFAVWRGPEHHAALFGLDEALLPHLPAEVMEGSSAPFSLGHIDEIRVLFRKAGFGRVHVRNVAGEVRFQSVREMVDAICGAHAPLAAAIAALGGEAQDRLYGDLEDAFFTYRDDDGVMFTMTAAVILARK